MGNMSREETQRRMAGRCTQRRMAGRWCLHTLLALLMVARMNCVAGSCQKAGNEEGNSGGSLSLAGYSMTLGGTRLMDGSRVSQEPGVSAKLTLDGPEFSQFLITAQKSSLTLTSGNGQEKQCAGDGFAGALTHRDTSVNTAVAATLTTACEPGEEEVSVTVVETKQKWYRCTFKLTTSSGACSKPNPSSPSPPPASGEDDSDNTGMIVGIICGVVGVVLLGGGVWYFTNATTTSQANPANVGMESKKPMHSNDDGAVSQQNSGDSSSERGCCSC